VVSFAIDGFSAEQICRHLDTHGVALRGGQHCAQPLIRAFGVEGAARASLAPYSQDDDIDVLLTGLEELTRVGRLAGSAVVGCRKQIPGCFANMHLAPGGGCMRLVSLDVRGP
jgi:hypothetical protein